MVMAITTWPKLDTNMEFRKSSKVNQKNSGKQSALPLKLRVFGGVLASFSTGAWEFRAVLIAEENRLD
jgi:hypothetical protein